MPRGIDSYKSQVSTEKNELIRHRDMDMKKMVDYYGLRIDNTF